MPLGGDRSAHEDTYEQGALRPPIFEPGMLAAVDLDELTQTRAPMAGLVRPTRADGAGQAELDQDAARSGQRLRSQPLG